VKRAVAWLAKQYVIHSPVQRGKGAIVRELAPRLPLRHREFDARLPDGGLVRLRWDEWLGRHYLLHGSAFDPVELEFVRSTLAPGSAAIDVGANVGVYTVAAALAGARVIAVEADGDYIPRLRENLARNGIGDVDVVAAAAGDVDGEAELTIATDRSFSTIKQLASYSPSGEVRRVPVRRLDTIWTDAGEPDVSLVKIDVEGAEVEVLRGAERLLDRCRPALIVEVSETTEPEVRSRLSALGYEDSTPPGFDRANRAYTLRSR
jgi:FkbM family methyltransferase